VAYRNRFPLAAEPILKVGDSLPELQLATWLNAAGVAAKPDHADKILLIDFWGTACGPCVAQLAEVNEAARHFADSKIAIIGLHDSSGQSDALIEFVKKRGLEFPIAIDKPAVDGTGFGATFRAFGIDAIPTSVVIDGGGKVAYLGDFTRAIEVADQLAKGKSPNR
jgi:peroxiredoxin